jgi:IS605 OrfB family transposase
VTSEDGNLVATRFFRDNRLTTASKDKRKWVLEDIVNRMLRWCRDSHGCNAVAVEMLRFKEAYDFGPKTNFKLSNFMNRKMLQTIRLHALKLGMLSVEVSPAYTSMVAMAKYGKRYGGFNRHELAAFVIARRALGYGEAPVLDCLPRKRKEKSMWNHCAAYYGHPSELLTLPSHEPLEWKIDRDVKGGRTDDELLTAPPTTITSAMRSSHSTLQEELPSTEKNPTGEWVGPIQTVTPAGEMGPEGTELSLRAHPSCVRRRLSSPDKEDSFVANS